MSVPKIEVAGKTDPGCVRERNEDSLAIDRELGLLIVADGMGGHNSGEVASGLATGTILEFARRLFGKDRNAEPPETEPKLSLRSRQIAHLIVNANSVIYEKSRAFPKDHGMGTTIVVVATDEESVTVGHVGDSRFYLLRKGKLHLLTEDHSLVMDQVKHGLLTLEQAEKSHLQNILTRALGTEDKVEVDVKDHEARPGDVFMICSDGLTKMISESEIVRVLKSKSPEAAVDELIGRAREEGGVDNVTVVVARYPKKSESGGLRGMLARLLGR